MRCVPPSCEDVRAVETYVGGECVGVGQGVEVYYKEENIWATQKAMATLFNVNIPAISKHLKNIFESGELKDDSVVSKMEITASDGKNIRHSFTALMPSLLLAIV